MSQCLKNCATDVFTPIDVLRIETLGQEMIYSTSPSDLENENVLRQIHDLHHQLADYLRTPRRWESGLRRSLLARAIRGSNSIEGYHVEIDDAAAALDGEEPRPVSN